jgi:hypothetical protein
MLGFLEKCCKGKGLRSCSANPRKMRMNLCLRLITGSLNGYGLDEYDACNSNGESLNFALSYGDGLLRAERKEEEEG